MKKQFLIIAILFAAYLFSTQAARAQGTGAGSGIPELTEVQHKALLAVLAENKKKAESLFPIITESRIKIEKNYISDRLDNAALQKLKIAMMDAVCKLLTLRLDAGIRMVKLLTPEQKRFVVQMIEESGFEKDAYRVLLDAYNLPDITQ